MTVRHLVHILSIVYNSIEHVTWKSPGPMCGWVGRILLPDWCISGSIQSASFIHLVCCCASLSTTFALSQSMTWFSSSAQSVMADLWVMVHCSPLLWTLGSVYQLWKSTLLSVLLHPRAELPACLNVDARDRFLRRQRINILCNIVHVKYSLWCHRTVSEMTRFSYCQQRVNVMINVSGNVDML